MGKCKAMHGRGGEERKRTRHMWTTPTRGNPIVSAAPDVYSSSSSSANSFFKVCIFFDVIIVISFAGVEFKLWVMLLLELMF